MLVSLLCLIEPKITWFNALSLLVTSVEKSWPREDDYLFSIMIPVSGENVPLQYTRVNSCSQVSLVSRYDAYPTLNKLRMLPARPLGADVHLLLDHDMLVIDSKRILQVISDYPNHIQAVCNRNDGAIAGFGEDFIDIFNNYTKRSFLESPYVNAGFVIFPEAAADKVSSDWPEAAASLTRKWHPREKIRPYGNASLSMSISKVAGVDVKFRRLDSRFNQRNWQELPSDPVIVHYNNFDKLNIEVKERYLAGWDEFEGFMDKTDNCFWVKYRSFFEAALTESSKEFALTLANTTSSLITKFSRNRSD
jgi:hypothetical protein